MDPRPEYIPTTLHRAIRSHSVFLFDSKRRENGSGVLIQLGDRFFVLSAEHVLNADVDLFLDIPLPETRFTILHKWFDKALDIGFLELKPFEVLTLRGQLSNPFKFGIQMETEVPTMKPNLALCGFPRALSQKGPNFERVPIMFLTVALVPPDKWPQPYIGNLDPSKRFLLAYGPKRGGNFFNPDGSPLTHFKPHGMSGTGLWYFKEDNNQPNPDYGLLGIQHGYDEFYQVLSGTFLKPVIESLVQFTGIPIPE